MLIADKIADDCTKALKSGDKNKVSVLRMIKASMKNREIEKKTSLTDEDMQSILLSFVKRSKESIEQFSHAGRSELAQKEKDELMVIQHYLPRQLSEEETREIVKGVIAETGASGPRDLGKVMKTVMAKLKGQGDGKVVNKLVKEMLEA